MEDQEIVISPYVITDGDEGVQVNIGTRFAFAGSGYGLEGFSEAVKILKKILDSKIRITSSQESDWIKNQLDLTDWGEINALAQKQIKLIADKEGLLYAGYLPFTDPRKLKYDIKGHMVRPKLVHVGNKICFSLGGGEQVYNLGCYRISADWVSKAPKKLVEKAILSQIKFYKKLSGMRLNLFYELGGDLGEKMAQKNLKMLKKIGLKMKELPLRG